MKDNKNHREGQILKMERLRQGKGIKEVVDNICSVSSLSKIEKGKQSIDLDTYLKIIRNWVPKEPVIHIDDSDVVKPKGYKFESLGFVRDGSESTSVKSVYKKGYHVTEACVLTISNHPVSIFSEIHSSKEKNFTSLNNITFSAMERTLCMAFLAHTSMKSETNAMKVSIIRTADPIKEKVHFSYYRLAKGISGILSYAKEGVRLWFRTKRPAYIQLCLKLIA